MNKFRKILVNKDVRKTIIIFLSLFVTITFSLKLDIGETLSKNIFESLVLFICLNLLFEKTFLKNDIVLKKNKIYKIILSILFSSFMIFGYSYMKINSWDVIFKNVFQILKTLIKGIGYYIVFRTILNYIFDILFCNITVKETSNKIYNFIFKKHSFIIPLIIILICWIPYIIAFYPGILFQDSSNQIRQYFGYDIPEDSSTNSVNLIDENVKITNHHPVVHTIILGLCMQLGKIIGNDNLGVFTYILLQIMLLSSTFAYVINFMKKLKIPNWVRIFSLGFFALLPIIPIYAMEVTKDVPFTCFIIIYIIQIYKLIQKANEEKINIRNSIKIIMESILVVLFRNNGIYVIIMSLPLIAIIDKLNRKKILILSLIIVILYEEFNSILLPTLKISKASIREALSIPFQQTDRYVKKYSNEIPEEEKVAIDKVLDYDTLPERYDPLNADPVKNKYNKDTTSQELKNYIKVWFQELIRHPCTYIQATMNNTYGYFYPESKIRQYTTDFIVDSHESINKTGDFNYSYIQSLKPLRQVINKISKTAQIIPGISWLINIALNVWLIITLFVYLLYIRKYKYLIYLMPFISIILVCIASPINAYYRYAISYIFAMPLTISIFIDILKREENKNEK